MYFTLLSSASSASQNIFTSFHRNVADIIQLHESLITEIRNIVPKFDAMLSLGGHKPRRRTGMNLRSQDASHCDHEMIASARMEQLSSHAIHPVAKHGTDRTIEPKVVAEVARVFNKMVTLLYFTMVLDLI